uniref:Uncharacterized protein n=1 Tax=Salmonella phage PMBT31 TaxID=3153514 RepID=A0AAU8GN08_9CAUD
MVSADRQILSSYHYLKTREHLKTYRLACQAFFKLFSI